MSGLLAYLRRHHLALVALFVALSGTAYAATQLPRNSVGTTQIKRKAVTLGKIAPSARKALKGEKGATGRGGPPGPPGQSLTGAGESSTGPNPHYSNRPVVPLPEVSLASEAPSTPSNGVSLVDGIRLGPGAYLADVTFQTFDLDSANTGNDPSYGVASLFLESAEQGTIWTSQIPNDGNNAAQGSGTFLVTVPSGGGSLTLRGVVRSSAPPPVSGNLAEGGAQLIVTSL